jgi:HEPN domain-containing protein
MRSRIVNRPAGTQTSTMANRWADWLRQAERDLDQARASRIEGRHEWACFAAHQPAEKAVEALHLHLGQEAWGHVVAKLIAEWPVGVEPPQDLQERARVLDDFYVPARYPNGHPEGAPFEHYGPLQSGQAVDHAGAILDFVRSQVA